MKGIDCRRIIRIRTIPPPRTGTASAGSASPPHPIKSNRSIRSPRWDSRCMQMICKWTYQHSQNLNWRKGGIEANHQNCCLVEMMSVVRSSWKRNWCDQLRCDAVTDWNASRCHLVDDFFLSFSPRVLKKEKNWIFLFVTICWLGYFVCCCGRREKRLH